MRHQVGGCNRNSDLVKVNICLPRDYCCALQIHQGIRSDQFRRIVDVGTRSRLFGSPGGPAAGQTLHFASRAPERVVQFWQSIQLLYFTLQITKNFISKTQFSEHSSILSIEKPLKRCYIHSKMFIQQSHGNILTFHQIKSLQNSV